MAVKGDYKQTEVGFIPEDWEVNCIGDITDVKAGGTPSTLIKEYWNGSIRWMSSGELNNKRICDVEGRITELGLKNSSASIIPINSVLIGLAGQGKTRGTVALNYVELCTNQSIASIYPNKNVSHEFMYQYLESQYEEIRLLSYGEGGRGGLNLRIIKSIKVPIPPLQEQKAIATALSNIDNLINLLTKLIGKKKNIKQGAMQELLTGKKRLDGFSGGWLETTLEELCDIKRGASPRPIEKYISHNSEGINWIRIGDVEKSGIIKKTHQKIIENGKNKSIFVNVGDLLLSNSMSFGKPYLLEIEGCIHDGWLAISEIKDKVDKKFLFYFLMSQQVKKYFLDMSAGSGVKNLKKETVAKLAIILPIIKEQTAIATILSDMDSEIETLQLKLDKYKAIKQGMMQELLTGRIRLLEGA